MSYAGSSPYAGAAPFAGAAPTTSSTPAAGSPFGGSFAGARPFAGPAPFAGAPSAPPATPTTVVVATDFVSFADGTQPTAGAAFGLFDAFTGTYGTPLQSHAPTGGSGSWAKHGAMPSGALAIGGYGGNRLARGSYAGLSVYCTDSGHAGADVRATWSQGDDEVVLAADGRCGVGLRVDPTVDTGYYAIGSNDDATATYRWAIIKRVAGAETVLAAAAKSSLVLTPASLDFTAVGSTLTLKVNGSTVATASDSAIPGPGRFAAMFSLSPQSEGNSWIDDLSIGGLGAATKLAPERVVATVVGAEVAGWAEALSLTVTASASAAIASADGAGSAEAASVLATIRGGDAVASADLASILAGLRGADAVAAIEPQPSISAALRAGDAAGIPEAASIAVGLVGAESWSAADLAVVVVAPAGFLVVTGVDSSAAGEAAGVAAAIRAVESAGWTARTFAAVGLCARDATGADECWAVRTILATLSFSIYRDTGSGTPIDYETPVATTTTFAWTSPPLGRPGVWSFGVRASDLGGEEKNLDAAVTIRLDAAGVDVSLIPDAPTSLRAFPRAGGVVRLEWHFASFDRTRRPTGYRIYKGSPTVDYGTVAATAPYDGRAVPSFDLTGLADGVLYELAVRAFNAAGESAAAAVASCRADATGPPAVSGLALSPIATEPT